ncbi:hypothetical protein GE061_018941 [Apolygus lucorum]|uniref:Uncharacterized protein n=1 Tax=Apolygus lucorum TaxID=248454 RepID=A0A6A4JX19_APOLU|nr:hypothetical protein GE061_018941 [Apolygus lucorum]
MEEKGRGWTRALALNFVKGQEISRIHIDHCDNKFQHLMRVTSESFCSVCGLAQGKTCLPSHLVSSDNIFRMRWGDLLCRFLGERMAIQKSCHDL